MVPSLWYCKQGVCPKSAQHSNTAQAVGVHLPQLLVSLAAMAAVVLHQWFLV